VNAPAPRSNVLKGTQASSSARTCRGQGQRKIRIPLRRNRARALSESGRHQGHTFDLSFQVKDITAAIRARGARRGVATTTAGFKTVDHVAVVGSEKAAWFRPEGNTSAFTKICLASSRHERRNIRGVPRRHARAAGRFDTRRLADRLDEELARQTFSDEDRAFIESRAPFFLATADERGRPDCSFKGGAPASSA